MIACNQDRETIVTTDKDVWAIDFTAALEEGETVTGGAATLVRVRPPYMDLIDDFVVGTPSVVGAVVQVSWDAADLKRGEAYELLTVATISGGATNTHTIGIEVTG